MANAAFYWSDQSRINPDGTISMPAVGSSRRVESGRLMTRLLTAACLATASLGVSLHASDPASTCPILAAELPGADRPNAADLQYRVVPKTTEIEFNGKLWMTAELHNLGNRKLTVFWGDYAYPKMYHFDVTHDSGKRLAVTRDFPGDWLPHAAESRFFVTIEPGESAKYQLLLTSMTGANGELAYFRRCGQYRVEASLFVATTDILDRKTGDTRPMPGAWTGFLKAEPFTITVVDRAKRVGKGVSIGGRVIDERGIPVADTLVLASRRVDVTGTNIKGTLADAKIDQTFSDDHGCFEFEELPSESPSFLLEAHSENHPPARVAVFNEPAPEGSAKVFETEIKLADGITLAGRVVDSAGRPCVDARLDFYPPIRHVFTGDDGRFTLKGITVADEFRPRLGRRGFAETTVQVSRAVATGGEWTITLLREREQSFSGRAGFLSGMPFADMKIALSLTPADQAKGIGGPTRFVSAATIDVEGRYSVILPRNEPFDVVAFASKESMGPGTFRPTWPQTVGRVSPGQGDVNVLFDDRQTLAVRVSPKNEVRDPMQFQISSVLLDSNGEGRNQVVAQGTLNSMGGTIECSRLCPGKYRVDLATTPLEYMRLSQAVELVVGADKPQLVEFKPEFKVGRIKGLFVNAEGQPISGRQIWIDGPLGSGWLPLDSEGRFDTVAAAGVVRLIPRADGQTGEPVKASVKSGQTTDLGQIVVAWQSLKRASGTCWVEGRVLYDDGSPALGAVVKDVLQKQEVGADGSYRWHLSENKPMLSISLANADGWPRWDIEKRLAPITPFSGADDHVDVAVPVKPNKTVRRDVILPRNRVSSLVIRNVDVPVSPNFLFLRTVSFAPPGAKDVATELLSDELQFVQSRFFKIEPGGTKTISGVPLGHCVVTLSYPDFSRDAYFVAVTDMAKPSELAVSRQDFGQIEVRLADNDGKLRPNIGLKVVKLLAGTKSLCFDSSSHPSGVPLNRFLVTVDGTMIVRDLSAGSYELTVHDGEMSKTMVAEVLPRGQTLLELRTEDLQ